MADANRDTVRAIYIEAWKNTDGTQAQKRNAARKAVKKAGWFLKDGKWMKNKGKPSDKNSFMARADENKKLASYKVVA